MRRRISSIRKAFLIWPSGQEWGWCLVIYGLGMLVTMAIGFGTGFLTLHIVPLTPFQLGMLALLIFLKPCLVEESIFRGLLLPHPSEQLPPSSIWKWSLFSLLIFIASHPLNGWLIKPAVLVLFLSPIFLTCAGILGLVCTLVYLRTGSIWPPVILHWMSVVVWITLLGGKARLMGTAP
ncbi:MAG TPA: CPBP family glutamic-type intramembrane protease [Acidobacteriota bacterium]|nr:CPBP family glutamic-type intramembrane protease [Acidobacteriota bacterium]HND18382.1 CPBP family glutamic-type intramembrane protease [Acidobacteriota bacterium]